MKHFFIFSMTYFLSTFFFGVYALTDKDFKNSYERNAGTAATEQQQKAADNYVHEGFIRSKSRELCSGRNREVCDGDEAQVFGELDRFVPMVSKAYALLVGFSGVTAIAKDFSSDDKDDEDKTEAKASATPTPTATGTATASGTATPTPAATVSAKKNKDNKALVDYVKYCDVIPGATELAAGVAQAYENKQIDTGSAKKGFQQREEILKVARTHKARAKTATYQAAGYSTTAVCYIGVGHQKIFEGDWKHMAKIGASTFLATFYILKRQAHLDYADKAKKIANQIPGPGACNPITEPQCFCTEPTSTRLPEFRTACVAEPFQSRTAGGNEGVPCLGPNGQVQTDCPCLQPRNQCLASRFNAFAANIPGGVNNASATSLGLRTVTDGRLNTEGANSQNASRVSGAKRFLERNKTLDKKFGGVPLNANQKKEFDQLQRLGFSRGFSRLLAKRPVNKKFLKKFSAPNLKVPAKKLAGFNNNSNRGQVVRFNNNNFNRSFGSKKDYAAGFNKFNQKRNVANGGQVFKYAERATQKAQIDQRSGESIFKIISHRYRRRAWTELPWKK